MSIEFINILRNAGLEPTAIEIAEMLLVAAYIPAPTIPAAIGPGTKKKKSEEKDSATNRSQKSPESNFDQLKPASAPQMSDAGGLFAETEEDSAESEGGVETIPFRTPRSSALPGAHKIARALRPLRCRYPSNHHFVFDEEQTIRQITDGGAHSLVMKPAPERWLDAALVFDRSLTMHLWRPTMMEVQRLFERCGVFRDVRSWHLNTDSTSATLHSAVGDQAARSWRELLDPTGRRLIVVFSDCHAESWHNGNVYRMLADLGGQSPVVMVQVLPERFWSMTTMTPVDATLRARRSGLSNKWLEVSPAWYGDLICAGGFPLPVVTLEEWSITSWAQMVAGTTSVTTRGLIVPPFLERGSFSDEAPAAAKKKSEQKNKQKGDTPGGGSQPSAQERIQAFLNNASLKARQLAFYFASAPLNLPVIQLVQQAMLPTARQSHLAEFFLGGLIYQPASRSDQKPNPDEIIFEFYEGVREELINRTTKAETVLVINTVSRYIEQRLGEGGEFGSLLALPSHLAGPVRWLDPLSRRFAQLSTQILQRFGGYESTLQRIEKIFGSPDILEDVKRSQLESAESLHERARQALVRGDTGGAEECYLRILSLYGDDHNAWAGLSEIVKNGPSSKESIALMLVGLCDTKDNFVRKLAADAIDEMDLTSPEFSSALQGLIKESDSSVSAEAYVNTFRTSASKGVFEFACSLAVVPLSLPIARIVQHATHSDLRQSHLVEVLVSGLIYQPNRRIDQVYRIEEITFEFQYGVREFLLDCLSRKELMRAINVLSKAIEVQTREYPDFSAFINALEKQEKHPPGLQHFAEISTVILNRLRVANQLRGVTINESDPETPSLLPFTFTTLSIDAEGKEISRRVLSGRQFIEDLGEGLLLEMVEIPGGTFLMGSPEGIGRDSERPQHEVTVPAFFIGKFTITQAQWRIVAGWPRVKIGIDPTCSRFKGYARPVDRVNWEGIQEFCARLNQQSGRVFRLPSEAEWEYACRAATTTPFAFGPAITKKIVNYDGKETVAVGSLGTANAFGLYDLHGNLWEWCNDNWHKNYAGAPRDGSAWLNGGESGYRVLRGGSFYSYSDGCRSSYRVDDRALTRYDGCLGFRVVVGARNS